MSRGAFMPRKLTTSIAVAMLVLVNLTGFGEATYMSLRYSSVSKATHSAFTRAQDRAERDGGTGALRRLDLDYIGLLRDQNAGLTVLIVVCGVVMLCNGIGFFLLYRSRMVCGSD